MLGWLKGLLPISKKQGRRDDRAMSMVHRARLAMRASYDAAQTTDENKNHWAKTDSLSALGANSLDVRKKLRERARYERANSSYDAGITLTLANNLIGPGPRLQITTPDTALNAAVEKAFGVWAQAVRLSDQLRTMKMAKTTDGEAFVLFTNNPTLPTSVTLDLRLVECDQFTTPDLYQISNPNAVDGIVFDDYGNPAEYHVLRSHPGDGLYGFGVEYDRVPARRVLHWFRCDRPGQVRGIPELTPALPLFAMHRRWTLAELLAAEIASCHSVLLKSTGPADSSETDDLPEFWSKQEITRGMATVLPDGYDLTQMDAKHPNANMEMFTRLILREIARCLNIPWNIAAGDSSSYNFSSAKLDHLIYRQAMQVERQDCEREVLDPTFTEWLDEAVMIPGLLPPGVSAFMSSMPHRWHWPAWDQIDITAEAAADTERLGNGTTTLAAVCAERGEDWQEVIRQRAREEAFTKKVRGEYGLADPAAADPAAPVAASLQAAGIDACGGKGGKPGPCSTGGAAAKGARTPKAPNVKVKAATEKVAKINAKVTVAKKKLDGLKTELKAAKADLKAVKGTVVKKAAASSGKAKETSEALKNLESTWNSEGGTGKTSSDAMRAQIDQTIGKAPGHELAKQYGLKRKFKTAKEAKAAVVISILQRVGMTRRVQV